MCFEMISEKNSYKTVFCIFDELLFCGGYDIKQERCGITNYRNFFIIIAGKIFPVQFNSISLILEKPFLTQNLSTLSS